MKRLLLFILLISSVSLFSQTNIGTTKYINSASDLPEVVDGEYLCDSMTNYILNTMITTSTPFRLQNGTTFRGSAAGHTRITYVGDSAAFRANDAGVTLRGFQIVATGGTNTCAYDFRDSSRTKFCNVLEMFIIFSDSVGGYYGYEVVNHLTNLWKDCGAGVVFDSVYYFAYVNNELRTPATGSGYDVVTYRNIDDAQGCAIKNSLWVTQNVGDTCIRIEAHAPGSPVSLGSITGCDLEGPGHGLAGLPLPENPEWLANANIGFPNDYAVDTVTTVQMSGYVNPKTGLILFNQDLGNPVIWDGDEFLEIQTSLIYTNQLTEDWESGSYATNGWTAVNGGGGNPNKWYVGTADPQAGTYSSYISNNSGTSNAYTINNSCVSHIYIDIAIPGGINDYQIRFNWKCEGEVGYDGMQVYNAPTSVTPVAGSTVSATYLIGGPYYNTSVWQETGLSIGNGDAGTTRRFIFSWINDGSVGTQPPSNIDNIEFNYN